MFSELLRLYIYTVYILTFTFFVHSVSMCMKKKKKKIQNKIAHWSLRHWPAQAKLAAFELVAAATSLPNSCMDCCGVLQKVNIMAQQQR